MSERQMVSVRIDSFDVGEFFPMRRFTLLQLRGKIDSMIAQDSKDGIEYEYDVEYPSYYENAAEIVKYGKRPETDSEFAERLKKEVAAAKRKQAKEEREYQRYLKLKEKFGA